MSDVQIEICSIDFEARRITGKKDGREFMFREQGAYMHLPGDPYPARCKISLGERPPWPLGRYTLSPACYRVGQYGSPELVRELVLVPVAAALPERPTARAAGG